MTALKMVAGNFPPVSPGRSMHSFAFSIHAVMKTNVQMEIISDSFICNADFLSSVVICKIVSFIMEMFHFARYIYRKHRRIPKLVFRRKLLKVRYVACQSKLH